MEITKQQIAEIINQVWTAGKCGTTQDFADLSASIIYELLSPELLFNRHAAAALPSVISTVTQNGDNTVNGGFIPDDVAKNIAKNAHAIARAMMDEGKNYQSSKKRSEDIFKALFVPSQISLLNISSNGSATIYDDKDKEFVTIDWLKILFEYMGKNGFDPEKIKNIQIISSLSGGYVNVKKEGEIYTYTTTEF